MKKLLTKTWFQTIVAQLMLVGFPLSAFAQQNQCNFSPSNGLEGLINFAICLLSGTVIRLMFAVALVVFIWGVVTYIRNAGNETERQKGQQFMLWGIIGLFVMTAVWGLVNILLATFDIQSGGSPTLPTLTGSS